MWYSSIGFHTFSIYRRIDKVDFKRIINDFKQYSADTGDIKIYPTDHTKKCYRADYVDRYRGLYWQFRYCSAPDFKEYIVEAKVNPKVLGGDIDYVSAANESHMPRVVSRFNEEARKISKWLGDFRMYWPNRIDYCVNLYLLELGVFCSDEQMMALIKRSDVPAFYRDKYYDAVSHRMKTHDNQHYLKSKSVVVNCYGKYAHLLNYYPDNPSLEDSNSVIRFEIQFKKMKLYRISNMLLRKGKSDYEVMMYLFSDMFARNVIAKYYNRIIKGGDYYTLNDAIKKVESKKFKSNKERRMVETVRQINEKRSISEAKKIIKNDGGDISIFNRALHELVEIGINPVTIPMGFGIRHIPNLLNAYFHMEFTGVSHLDYLDEYFAERRMSRKRKK